MRASIFVSAIGTDVGKTVISAILVRALQADYWKPVQCGNLDELDSTRVREFAASPSITIHPEQFLLKTPLSPHAAAKLEGRTISLADFKAPSTKRDLVIEGAGGLMVPLNDSQLVIDLIEALQARVVLVSKNYLGSINHTLLSLEVLRQRQIPMLGIIFNGEPNMETERVIESYSGCKILGRVRQEAMLSCERIKHYADTIRENMLESLRA